MQSTQPPSEARLIFIISFILLAFVGPGTFFTRGSVSASSYNARTGTAPQAQQPAAQQNALAYSPGNDGTTTCHEWRVVPSPSEGTNTNTLSGVAVAGPNDLWSVGSYLNGSNLDKTLIEHWNGSVWSIVPSPSPGSDYNYLWQVAAVAATDVWAAGAYRNSGGVSQTLIEHWNGSVWSIVPSPSPGSWDNGLSAVGVVGANDVWAVGGYISASHVSQALIEHWDGSAWSVVPSPSPGSWDNGLSAVGVVGANDVWAVGFYYNVSQNQTLIEHWDGSVWSIVSSPNVGVNSNYLKGVAAAGLNDVRAVGSYYNSGEVAQTLIEHWNGNAWSILPSPNPLGIASLDGVAVASPNDVWAVGSGDAGSMVGTLVERYNLCAYISPTPATTPIPPTAIATPEATSTPKPPPCPGERFKDVCPDDYFYTMVLALNDAGIISGYSTSPPCPDSLWIPCFNPYDSSTRGQISKIVSLAANFNDPITTQTFQDVPPGSTFYAYAERLAEREIVSGYPCGSPGEPCVPPANRPYFRTNNSVTRGQLSKMASQAFGWNDPMSGQTFEDVPPDSTFYGYIERLYERGLINGYPCGNPGIPCVPPGNLPYFRPNNNVTRGQSAKIVELARTQPTSTPSPTPTPSIAATPTPPPRSTSSPMLTVVPTVPKITIIH